MPETIKNIYVKNLLQRTRNSFMLDSVHSLLSWDSETYMPEGSAELRAQVSSAIKRMVHEITISLDENRDLSNALLAQSKGELSLDESAIVRTLNYYYQRLHKVPPEFEEELNIVTEQSQVVWRKARADSDFSSFLPYFEKIVSMKRQLAEYIGYTDSPYDALLNDYEEGITSKDIEAVFNPLKKFLQDTISQISSSEKDDLLTGNFPLAQQKDFCEMVSKRLGLDFQKARLDVSVHPFSSSNTPHDTRITTRFDETNIVSALSSTVHETGHALYEQGLPVGWFGTPLCSSVSFSVHESQSKIWETMIGQSKPFAAFLLPLLQEQFPEPFAHITSDQYFKSVNKVQPSFIRVDADEVTYHLHIILRYEIEKGLIEGSIAPKDVPHVWNTKFKELFGIEVPNDALGCLQDVHWSLGYIGYFPTYSLGTLYAAQLFAKVKEEIPNLDEKIEKGDFSEFLLWLRKHVHNHGTRYVSLGLVQNATGNPFSSEYFMDYIREKYLK